MKAVRPTTRYSTSLAIPLVLIVVASAAAQSTVYVAPCGNDDWTGSSNVCQAPDGPKATIQAGLNAASDGEVVELANGIYTGPGNKNLNLGGRLITLRSASGDPSLCVIDCENGGSGIIFDSGETANTVVEGLTIMRASRSFSGGGVHIENSSPTIRDCVIADNSSSPAGGGMYILGGNPSIINCAIVGNSTTNFFSAFAKGAGAYVQSGSPVFVNCLLANNSSGGGAMSHGGGLHIAEDGHVLLTGCTVSGNYASETAGLENFGELTMDNCIVQDNDGKDLLSFYSPHVTHSNVHELCSEYCFPSGSASGFGNIDADPMFADAQQDDFRLLPDSPCVDSGLNGIVPLDVNTDLDGHPRIVDGNEDGQAVVDMGAYETPLHCPADFNRDGMVGPQDLAQLLGTWGPYEPCPPYDSADFNADCGVNAADLAQLLGSWGPC